METKLTKEEVEVLLLNIGNVLEDVYGVQPGDDISVQEHPLFTAFAKLKELANATK